MPNQLTPPSLFLQVRKMGHVPSFKNKKRIGKKGVFTETKAADWMKAVILDFECQLNSAYQTYVRAMGTEVCPLSWIASSVPADDSLKHMEGEYSVDLDLAPEGEEGADIQIERLPSEMVSGRNDTQEPEERQAGLGL